MSDEEHAKNPQIDKPEEMQIDLGYDATPDDTSSDEETAPFDTIQTLSLDQMVIEEKAPSDLLTESATVADQSATLEQAIITLSEVVPEDSAVIDDASASLATVDTPGETDKESSAQVRLARPESPPPSAATAMPPPRAPFGKPLPTKSDNPFLPQHILDKLNQGRKHMTEDFVQSSAALDVNLAILRTQARADRLNRPQTDHNNNPFSPQDPAARAKQKVVDDLVDEYLPLVAAELRRRLNKLLDS